MSAKRVVDNSFSPSRSGRDHAPLRESSLTMARLAIHDGSVFRGGTAR